MIYFSLFIPLIAIIVLFIIKKTITPIYLIPIIFIICPFIMKSCSISNQVKANEVLGGNVKSASYYEYWNEYISKTCTREVNCSTDKNENRSCQTETYDCSYVEEHPEYWEMSTSFGEELIEKSQYNYLKTKFGNSNFVNMGRNYYTIDGNAYRTIWPGDSATFETHFINHNYENRIQASNSVFKFRPADTIHYKLFPRTFANDGDVNSFLSQGIAIGRGNKILNYYNAKFGKSKELRMIVLVFKNQPLEIAIEQENYWIGGNKNEFVVCIGVNDSGEIIWTKSFSWTMKKELLFSIRDSITSMKKFDGEKIANYLGSEVPKKWIRRQFKEFSYLDIQESSSTFIWCYFLMSFLSLSWFIFGLIFDKYFRNTLDKF